MAITFYYSPLSSAARIHWALEELGVPYEKVRLDLKAGDQKKPEFLKLNPNGKVPTLVDDGTPMFESVAQLIHLGDKYGVEKKLWPAPGAERMQALSWTVWSTATLGANLFRLLMNTGAYLAPELRSPGQAELAKKEMAGNLDVLEQRLMDRPYLLGEHFTLVDVSIASLLGWATRNGVDVAPWPRTAAWLARCAGRPGFATALAG